MNPIPLPDSSNARGGHRITRRRRPESLSAVRLRNARPSALGRRWAITQSVGGVRFVASTPLEAASDLVDAVGRLERGEHVHLANAYSVSLAAQSASLALQTFCSDGWNLPDGRPISVVSGLRRDSPRLAQIRGPQFFLDVCRLGVEAGVRHYLLGGSPETLKSLQDALVARFPGIRIVGSDSPPFRAPSAAELEARDHAIGRSGAQIVWVGLGTPKQDIEVARLAHELPVCAVAVGAAFDYAAGTLLEAPVWMTRFGLEWAFRFAVEPRRLWRRYVFGNLRFLQAVLRARR